MTVRVRVRVRVRVIVRVRISVRVSIRVRVRASMTPKGLWLDLQLCLQTQTWVRIWRGERSGAYVESWWGFLVLRCHRLFSALKLGR